MQKIIAFSNKKEYIASCYTYPLEHFVSMVKGIIDSHLTLTTRYSFPYGDDSSEFLKSKTMLRLKIDIKRYMQALNLQCALLDKVPNEEKNEYFYLFPERSIGHAIVNSNETIKHTKKSIIDTYGKLVDREVGEYEYVEEVLRDIYNVYCRLEENKKRWGNNFEKLEGLYSKELQILFKKDQK